MFERLLKTAALLLLVPASTLFAIQMPDQQTEGNVQIIVSGAVNGELEPCG